MVDEITSRMGAAVAKANFPHKVKFYFGTDGKVFIDGPAKTVTNEDSEAITTISVGIDDFVKMAQGKLSAPFAFMSGKLKVAGDMGVAMQIGPLLDNA